MDNISLHLKNIYQSGELVEEATAEDFSVVQKEGSRSRTKGTAKKHRNPLTIQRGLAYNKDMIQTSPRLSTMRTMAGSYFFR